MHGTLPQRIPARFDRASHRLPRRRAAAAAALLTLLFTLRGVFSFLDSPPLSSHEVPPPMRTLDGSGNHPSGAGAAGTAFRRLVPREAGFVGARPAPRRVSEALHAHPEGIWTQPDPLGRSILFAVFGQFLSHDLSLRAKRARPSFVRVGPGDSMFPVGSVLPFASNAAHPETGEPFNRVTAWIDGSMVYGSDGCRAAALRRFEGGELRVSAGDQLPRYGHDALQCIAPTAGLEGCPPHLENENPRREPETALFLAGDVRANENPVLLSLHTIFVREHNRRARALAKKHPDWKDERLYQEARRWVGALLQAITYEEYLPLLIGRDALRPYTGYRPALAAGISVEFAAAAFRFGHSQMGPTLFRNAPNGERFQFSDVSLKASYFATPLYEQADGGPGAWLSGATEFRAQPVDLAIIDDLRNYMFGGLRGGLDVASMNIAVGRESLAGSFNDLRQSIGLPRAHRFEDLSSDAAVARKLEDVYADLETVDPWVAMLAEAPRQSVRSSVSGETLKAVLVEQFLRLRDGDRFYYENDPALSDERANLRATRLADVIERNLRAPYREVHFQPRAFIARAEKPRR